MAILETSTKTGVSWIKESGRLLKSEPRKLIVLALIYVTIFMMMPSLPGFQWFGLITILIWPLFMAVVIGIYRELDLSAETTKMLHLGMVMDSVKPKVFLLLQLGGMFLLYGAIVSFFLNGDIKGLEGLAQSKDVMTESEAVIIMQKMLPLLSKLILLLIPLMMASWFSPPLIAFNNYSVIKAIKSSIAGSLQYFVALGVAWLLLTVTIVSVMLIVGIIIGITGNLIPSLAQLLMPLLIFGSLLIASSLMLSFQYVSYRDVFSKA